MSKKEMGTEAIYDARALGTPRMLVLGFQHLFAMFGATVLVPIITGLSVATTLLFAGIATFWVMTRTSKSFSSSTSPRWAALG